MPKYKERLNISVESLVQDTDSSIQADVDRTYQTLQDEDRDDSVLIGEPLKGKRCGMKRDLSAQKLTKGTQNLQSRLMNKSQSIDHLASIGKLRKRGHIQVEETKSRQSILL